VTVRGDHDAGQPLSKQLTERQQAAGMLPPGHQPQPARSGGQRLDDWFPRLLGVLLGQVANDDRMVGVRGQADGERRVLRVGRTVPQKDDTPDWMAGKAHLMLLALVKGPQAR
jgi:hypothetical protein